VNSFQGGLAMVVDTLLIVWVSSNQRTEPTSKLGKDLCVGIRHPTEDGGIVLFSLAKESGLLILGGDLHSMSVFGRISYSSNMSCRQKSGQSSK
jgi:hypothetical protein